MSLVLSSSSRVVMMQRPLDAGLRFLPVSFLRRASFLPAFSSSQFSRGFSSCGVVFDIDGVLVRGKTTLPGAQESVKLLREKKVPYLFCTNGGGIMEEERAQELSAILDAEVGTDQIILCHTPFRKTALSYRNKRVLVLGEKKCLEVAKKYGLARAVTPVQVLAQNPHLYEFIKYEAATGEDSQGGEGDTDLSWKNLHKDPIAAIFIFHDPTNWAAEVQLCLDLLTASSQPYESDIVPVDSLVSSYASPPDGNPPDLSSHHQSIPVFASNMDFIYSGRHNSPRLAQGAFTTVLDTLYRKLTGHPLHISTCGKPFNVTYSYALSRLQELAQGLGSADYFDAVYGIGDNPKSDIRGANSAGGPWHSVLVRTGVFSSTKHQENDPLDPAHFVVNDVAAAVDLILDRHQRK